MAFALLLWGGGRDVGSRKTHEIPGSPEGLCHSWDILTQPPRSRTCLFGGTAMKLSQMASASPNGGPFPVRMTSGFNCS